MLKIVKMCIRDRTKTADVISDVSTMKSEVGVLYLSDFNRKALLKLLHSANLEFHHLIALSAENVYNSICCYKTRSAARRPAYVIRSTPLWIRRTRLK